MSVKGNAIATQYGGSVLMIIGSCMSLQFGAALAAGIFPELGPWGVTQLRLGVAAMLLLLVVRPRLLTWTRDQWRSVLVFGVVLAGMNGCFYAAVDRIPLGTAVAIEFLGPLMLSAVLSRRRTDLIWVGVAFAGMMMLGLDSLTGEPLDPVGVGFALLAGGFWAGYVLMSAKVGEKIPGTGGLATALAVACIVLLPLGGHDAAAAFGDTRLLAVAAGTALLASVIPYTLELAALRRIPKHVFGVLLSLEPAFAAFAGWLILDQAAGPLKIGAIAAVIVASVGSTLTSARAARRSDYETVEASCC